MFYLIRIYFCSNKYIMAGGGGDFENPTFDDHFDDPNIPEVKLTEMRHANQRTQRTADQQIESMAHQTG